MTTPDDEPTPVGAAPDAGPGPGHPSGDPATVPGLVVDEERLPDGRRITYFGTSPVGTPR